MNNKFYIGQLIEGEGVKFEVIKLEPLTVKCIEIKGFWANYGKKDTNGNWVYEHGTHRRTWVVDEEYELRLGNSDIRNFNFNFDLPWCSCYEDGTFRHYR